MSVGAVTVSVPATSANLGPGFDAFGLALELRNCFRARLADEWSVSVVGEGAGVLPPDGRNQVARAMARVFAERGCAEQAASVECENAIPAGEGLGSSAAAIVGGMVLADRLCGADIGPDRLIELAASMEGHPDNVAAALLGGFTIAWDSQDGRAQAARIEPGCGLAAVIVMSDRALSTEESRGILPGMVPHEDAAFNAGRAGLLACGVALGDAALIRDGLADRIHEPYRRSAVPGIDEVKRALLEAGAVGAVLSGAGPTVAGLVTGDDDRSALAHAEEIASSASPSIEALDGPCAPEAIAISRSGILVSGRSC